MIKIAVCDIHAEFCIELRRKLLGYLGKRARVFVYSGKELWNGVDKEGEEIISADILFIETDLGEINGIEIAKKLQEQWSKLKVIFMSSKRERIPDIFYANPSYFLVKPLDRKKLEVAIHKVLCELEEQDSRYFVVTFKGRIFRVKVKDITYFESEKRTVILHCRHEMWKVYRKLDDIQESMPDYFLRCHQSYLVNMNEIKTIRPFRVELYQGNQIPISRTKYVEAKDCFSNFTGQRKRGKRIERKKQLP